MKKKSHQFKSEKLIGMEKSGERCLYNTERSELFQSDSDEDTSNRFFRDDSDALSRSGKRYYVR